MKLKPHNGVQSSANLKKRDLSRKEVLIKVEIK